MLKHSTAPADDIFISEIIKFGVALFALPDDHILGARVYTFDDRRGGNYVFKASILFKEPNLNLTQGSMQLSCMYTHAPTDQVRELPIAAVVF